MSKDYKNMHKEFFNILKINWHNDTTCAFEWLLNLSAQTDVTTQIGLYGFLNFILETHQNILPHSLVTQLASQHFSLLCDWIYQL
jgi:hypothetical protein